MSEMYYYWLHNVEGIGRVTLQKILKYTTPKDVYENPLEDRFSFLTKKQKENIKKSKEQWELKKEWEKIQKKGIFLMGLGKENYPTALSKIPDPPPVIYYKGNASLLAKPSVAVVGARACSNYGSMAAKELGRQLANRGIVVVSGMARGIDSICQLSALEQRGESIGVLGSGIEVCYPPENQKLYQWLQQQGMLFSENPPYMQPTPGLFPLRNRIISGLADVLVVVEAREKSGTLITVDMALEQGKDVYVIPGRMTDPVSRGCNKLIKQGAGVILSIDEFVEEICPLLQIKYQGKEEKMLPSVSKEERRMLQIIDTSIMSIEEIYEKMNGNGEDVSFIQIMEHLLELTGKGIIGEENGYYYLKESIVNF